MRATATPARYRGWEAAEEVLVVLDVVEIEFPGPDEVGLVFVVTGGVDELERVDVEIVELELDGPGLDELDELELEELDALEALEELEELEELDVPVMEVEVVVEVELVVELDVEICIGTP
jgi:hypothetical protein